MGQVIRTSADGSIIYGVDLELSSGQVYATDPATYAVTMPPGFSHQYWADLAVSPAGTLATVDSAVQGNGNDIGFFDSGLRMANFNEYPIVPDDGFGGVAWPLFSPGGAVLAAGLSDSIEFWDTKTGRLRARLLAPETLQWT